MPKVKFSASQLEEYTNSIIKANYLFYCNLYLDNISFYDNYQDYLNAFNEFLKSKDYQDSKKSKKGV